MRITVTGALSILARTWAMSATARPDINAPNTRDPLPAFTRMYTSQQTPPVMPDHPKTEHCHESAGHLYDDSHYPGPLHSHDLSAQGLCLRSLCSHGLHSHLCTHHHFPYHTVPPPVSWWNSAMLAPTPAATASAVTMASSILAAPEE